MVEVLVWEFSTKGLKGKGNIGHAALKVGSEYISWWPSHAVSLTSGRAPAAIHSEEDDLRAEGVDPDYRIRLHGLDESAILSWWSSFKDSNEYRLFVQNCSTVVALALKQGGGTALTKGISYLWDSWNLIWHPNDVLRYARAIEVGARS